MSYCLSSQLQTALPLLPAAKRPSLSPMIPNIFSAMYTCRWHCTMMTQRVYIYQVDGTQVISRNATLCSNSSSVKQQELPLDHCCLCVVQKCCTIHRGGKQGPAIAKSSNAMAAISSLLIQIPSAAYQQQPAATHLLQQKRSPKRFLLPSEVPSVLVTFGSLCRSGKETNKEEVLKECCSADTTTTRCCCANQGSTICCDCDCDFFLLDRHTSTMTAPPRSFLHT